MHLKRSNKVEKGENEEGRNPKKKKKADEEAESERRGGGREGEQCRPHMNYT